MKSKNAVFGSVVAALVFSVPLIAPGQKPAAQPAKPNAGDLPSCRTVTQKNKKTSQLPAIPQGCEINVSAEVWGYDRIYPLLDGLFQDVASTQVKSLILDPNSSNATNLDALTQSFQIQAGYNQLAGVQNSVASQMAVANLGYQSVLAQQSQSILQQQIAAQQQLYQAQQTLNTVSQTGDATAIAKAQQSVQAANANITNLATQMQLITQPSALYTPAGATGSNANALAAPSASLIPTAVQGTGTSTTGPSFPATKQMDNQVDLLWSRLARVVGAMTEPDSLKGGHVHLVEFNTSTFPGENRRNRLLDTTYSLTCAESDKPKPIVVDMFPRVAAVNITDTRYKDQSFNLGFLFAFFSYGVNAGYNREHLLMSQTLGQASYITGYGVGQSDFGWKFGIPLGDKIITSDIKRTFALIRVPEGCTPQLQMDGVWWSKANHTPVKDEAGLPAGRFTDVETAMKAPEKKEGEQPASDVTSISFNRTTYDPTKYSASNPASVSLVVTVQKALDPQVLVYANGILIKRARDTFGRAITSGGSGGLLETNTLSSVNTWIPTSSHSLLMTLDGAQFGAEFPTILIVPPTSDPPLAVGPNSPKNSVVNISGKSFKCAQSTECQLPSLAYKQPRYVHIGASRKKAIDLQPAKIIFTVADVLPVASSTTVPAHTSVQIVSGSSQQMWGTNVEVYASTRADVAQIRIHCDPTNDSGNRLLCEVPSGKDAPLDITKDLVLHIVDLGHRGGPIEGWAELSDCSPKPASCFPPTVWDIDNPQWIASADPSQWGHWELPVSFVNLDAGHQAQLENQDPAALTTTADSDGIYTATFKILPEKLVSYSDSMQLEIQGYADQKWRILNLASLLAPIASHLTIATNSITWFGANMVPNFYKQLIVQGSPSSPSIPIGCTTTSTCTGSQAMPASGGTLYVANQSMTEKLPLMQLDVTTGLLSPVLYTPPPAQDKKQTPGTVNAVPQSGSAPPASAPAGGTPAADASQALQNLQNLEEKRSVMVVPTTPQP